MALNLIRNILLALDREFSARTRVRTDERSRVRSLLPLTMFFASSAAVAQWTVGPYLTNPAYDCPPFVFVTLPKAFARFGTDARESGTFKGDLDLGRPGRQLWFMDRHRNIPVQLFPLAIHAGTLGLPTLPPLLQNGSVHEPTIYHDAAADQYWVIFSFAVDLTTNGADVSRPCDLFAIDLTTAISNPASLTPGTAAALPIVRLTNSMPGILSQQQMLQRIYARSFNPDLAPQIDYLRGVDWPGGLSRRFESNTGACVVDEEHGPVLYYASNRRRTDGQGMMAADLTLEGGLIGLANQREIHAFTTTSLISLFESPRGACGSYRSSTESPTQWSIFEFRSDEAEWQTVSGYGNAINIVDHNGTTVAIGDDLETSLLAISRYYVNNNESFGTIILLPYDKVGRNTDDGAVAIEQIGAFPGNERNLFRDVSETEDLPASPASLGKFAHPAGGRHADSAATAELFVTYSAAPSHGTNANDYDARLVAVTNLSAPIAAVNDTYLPNTPGYPVQLVLANQNLHCFAMKPVLTHTERFGRKHRRLQPLHGKVDLAGLPPALADMPVAQVIAGPIDHTDVRPMIRRLGSYDPTTVARTSTQQNKFFLRVACLTKDLPSVSAADVWGVRIYLTDAKIRQLLDPAPFSFKPLLPMTHAKASLWGYLNHDGAGSGDFGDAIPFERYRLLSDVPKNPNDGTVNFLLPANVPVKFMLLHNDGTVLAAHRNHHSFAPGQLERRCTGCHDHVSPSSGFANSQDPPFDTLTQTGKYERGANDVMAFHVYPTPSMAVPEFRNDIWPLLQSECGRCHDATQPLTIDGTHAFDLDMPRTLTWSEDGQDWSSTLDREVAVWAWLAKNRYVNRREGAAMSPLAWYFLGLDSDAEYRLDGRRNQDYVGHPGSRYWITTDFNGVNPHSRTGTYRVADRTKVGKVIEWIDGGAGITHNAVNGNLVADARRGLTGDGYPIAVSAKLSSFRSSQLVVGYWDAYENIATVRITVDSTVLPAFQPSGNGTHVFDLSPAHPVAPTTNVVVEVVDVASNRSVVQYTMRQLWLESETHRGSVSLTVDQPAFRTGDLATFSIRAPGHPNAYYLFLLGEGVQPGYDATGANLGVFLLQNLDPWLAASAALGIQGQLDHTGAGTCRIYVPAMPPTELYCCALVLAADGLGAKSNFETLLVK